MVNLIVGNLAVWLFFIFLIMILASLVAASMSFAPWVPCRRKDLARIFRLAELKPGQTFYDLGCGDGKVVIRAVSQCQVKAIGLELSLPFYLICKFKQILYNDKNIVFKLKNLYKEDLSQADAVYFFGVPQSVNGRLKDKLKQELKPGAKVVSYAFSLTDWRPVKVDKPSKDDLPIYLYVV